MIRPNPFNYSVEMKDWERLKRKLFNGVVDNHHKVVAYLLSEKQNVFTYNA